MSDGVCPSSPSTNCDLTDGIVSVALVHSSFPGMVLPSQMYPDLVGTYHPLQRRVVVEVIIARPEVWLWGQQAESNVTS